MFVWSVGNTRKPGCLQSRNPEGHGEEFCLHPKSNDWKAKCPNQGHNMFRFPFKEITLEVVWKPDLEAGKSRDSQTRLEAVAVAQIKMAEALDDLVVNKEKQKGLINIEEVKLPGFSNGLDTGIRKKGDQRWLARVVGFSILV